MHCSIAPPAKAQPPNPAIGCPQNRVKIPRSAPLRSPLSRKPLGHGRYREALQAAWVRPLDIIWT